MLEVEPTDQRGRPTANVSARDSLLLSVKSMVDNDDGVVGAVWCTAVPATIIDELSSDDTTVQEGDVVVLVCNVTGVPRPDVTWYRRPARADKMAERESKTCPLRSKGQGTSPSTTYTYRPTTRDTRCSFP